MKTFFTKYIKGNWRVLYGLYVFIYLPVFFLLESKITLDTPGIRIINIPFDDKIPFYEIFIIPYLLWFLYMACSCFYMVLRATDKEFLQMAWSLIIGMTLFLIISALVPNGLTLRPDYIPDNFLGRIVSALYLTDTSTNVFPSIHVYNSLAIHISLQKCAALKSHPLIRLCSLILCILICLSTLFLKQHSVIDAIGGIVMMVILYVLVYKVKWGSLFKILG